MTHSPSSGTRVDAPTAHRRPIAGLPCGPLAVTLCAMSVQRTSARFLILLCLLALQLQLFASFALACEHAGAVGDGTFGACPLHLGPSAPGGLDTIDAMPDCQKCVLGLSLAVYHQIAPASPVGLFGIPPIEAGSGPKHFYDFFSDRPDRPPISLQS